eukprot:11171250-Lingulodinium_polyedra.AAC.1
MQHHEVLNRSGVHKAIKNVITRWHHVVPERCTNIGVVWRNAGPHIVHAINAWSRSKWKNVNKE